MGQYMPSHCEERGKKEGEFETTSDIDKKSSTFSMIQGETYNKNIVKFRDLINNIDSNI